MRAVLVGQKEGTAWPDNYIPAMVNTRPKGIFYLFIFQ